MSPIAFTLTYLLILHTPHHHVYAYPFYYPLQPDEACKGLSRIQDLNMRVKWDLTNIYTPTGWTLPDRNLGPKALYKTSVCGAIDAAAKTCDDANRAAWCLEVTNLTNNECIQGIANWDSSSTIAYYAITSAQNEDAQILGIRVEVNDSDTLFNNRSCPDGHTTVHYDIQCRLNQTVAYSIYQDQANCYYTVNIHSEFGCVDSQPLPQQLVPYLIDQSAGGSCSGKSSIAALYVDQIEWNLDELASTKGFEKGDDTVADKEEIYRLSLCHGMADNASRCGSQRELCLELAKFDGTCVRPIAAWDDSSTVLTYALFSSSDAENTSLEGMKISLYDDSISDNSDECGSEEKPVNVNYELICIDDPDDDTIRIPWISHNETQCVYNITIESRWSCAKIVQHFPKESIIEKLSAGSIVLIIVALVFVGYVVVGCGYNGVLYGRVGFDAMPNKRMWHQFGRYTCAGCVTTKDCVCGCGRVPITYQEL